MQVYCSVASVVNDAPEVFPLGETTVTWTVTDGSGNTAECIQTILIDKVTTATTVSVNPTSQQYSDNVTLTATIAPYECYDPGTSATSVTFYIGSQEMGTVDLVNGVATATYALLEPESDMVFGIGEMSPGVKTVTAIFNGKDENFLIYDPTTSLNITCEDASVSNIGETYFTANPTNNTGTVSLSVVVVDEADGNRGDIRNAQISFYDGTSQLGSPVEVGLINPLKAYEGFATTNFNSTLNNSEISNGGKTWDVWAKTTSEPGFTSYYCGGDDEDVTIVTLAMPGPEYVTGGGYIVLTEATSGQYPAKPGSKMNFGLVMKWNKSGKSLQGKVNIIYRGPDGNNYQIQSNAINSLAVTEDVSFKYATITTKANLSLIYPDGRLPSDLGGNLNLVVTLWDSKTDNGGSSDRISVQLAGDKGSGIWFTSNWVGGRTIPQTLNGGNTNVGTNKVTSQTSSILEAEFGVKAYPNPFTDHLYFDLRLKTDSKVRLEIYDMNGSRLATLFNDVVVAFDSYRIEYTPENLSSGMLIYRLVIDDQIALTGKVIHK